MFGQCSIFYKVKGSCATTIFVRNQYSKQIIKVNSSFTCFILSLSNMILNFVYQMGCEMVPHIRKHPLLSLDVELETRPVRAVKDFIKLITLQ